VQTGKGAGDHASDIGLTFIESGQSGGPDRGGYIAGEGKLEAVRRTVKVAAAAPAEWQVVTRDLFKDFGAFTLSDLHLQTVNQGTEALFDHIYLGRTLESRSRTVGSHGRH
jgi:hypothetical protein